MKGNTIFLYIISAISIIFPIGYLIGLVDAKIAFPCMTLLVGIQSLFNGFFIIEKHKKYNKIATIIFGSASLLFSIFVVFPSYM